MEVLEPEGGPGGCVDAGSCTTAGPGLKSCGRTLHLALQRLVEEGVVLRRVVKQCLQSPVLCL
eukprot:1967979-Prorocentrum_lima.AAC.1